MVLPIGVVLSLGIYHLQPRELEYMFTSSRLTQRNNPISIISAGTYLEILSAL